ncbi:MAG: hypothetical protein ACREMV_01960 [Gemmatimonadales bacterium]
MRLLKILVNLIVATLVGAAGEKLLGVWGLILGFIAGGLAAWWVARRVLPDV